MQPPTRWKFSDWLPFTTQSMSSTSYFGSLSLFTAACSTVGTPLSCRPVMMIYRIPSGTLSTVTFPFSSITSFASYRAIISSVLSWSTR